MGSNVDFELVGKIGEFAKIEKEYVRIYSENGAEEICAQLKKWVKAVDLLDEIRGELANRSNLIVPDPVASGWLSKIRNNVRFESVRFIEVLLAHAGHEKDYLDDSDQALLDLTGRYDHIGYMNRKRQIGALVACRDLHDNVKSYFSEARECYALGLTKACISLCRALIEQSLCERDRSGSGELGAMITRVLQGRGDYGAREKAHRVRKAGNAILHPEHKDAGLSVSVESILLDAMSVVEHLHGRLR